MGTSPFFKIKVPDRRFTFNFWWFAIYNFFPVFKFLVSDIEVKLGQSKIVGFSFV